MLKRFRKKIDIDSLDLERVYSIEEFEYISSLVKNRSLVIEGEPVDHFELSNTGKLIPIPPTTFKKELTVTKIANLLEDWNITTRQKGVVTTSQGGFRISRDKIVAPDVAFTPRKRVKKLSKKQMKTFQGRPWSPIFVVEVDDFDDSSYKNKNSKFAKIDAKMKDVYFAADTHVQLGWLIDPVHENTWVYKRNKNNKPFRREKGWHNLSGERFLPEFTLTINLITMEEIEDAPSSDPETSSSSGSSTDSSVEQSFVQCVYCDAWFVSKYLLVHHLKYGHDNVV
ncbi:putative restriction endonuclease-domain-containing protein [Rhizophagus diaphanus]|nr:putative restriction endonuclease-domain-containing protein [Rhizophagus diaphanus] [Rhizophagus sp. MUCL 43196]